MLDICIPGVQGLFLQLRPVRRYRHNQKTHAHNANQKPAGMPSLRVHSAHSVAHSPLKPQLSCRVEAEGLLVWLDRIALRFPGRQSTFEKPDPVEMHSKGSMDNGSTGFVAWTSAICNRIFLSRDKRGVLEYFFGRNPLCPRDDLRIG